MFILFLLNNSSSFTNVLLIPFSNSEDNFPFIEYFHNNININNDNNNNNKDIYINYKLYDQFFFNANYPGLFILPLEEEDNDNNNNSRFLFISHPINAYSVTEEFCIISKFLFNLFIIYFINS
jgi:hypothetical protein